MIFTQLLYIFQSEHYDKRRFLKFVYSNFKWWSFSVRGSLDWTLRAKILCIISIFFFAISLFPFLVDFSIFSILNFIAIITIIFLFPFFIIFSDILISPFIAFQKNKILQNAKKLIENSKIISIGITGSYGKTTMKNICNDIFSEKYSVFVIPGNINTDLGIANFLLSHQLELQNADILLMEMGAFHIGEIASICSFIQPHYSFLTAIAAQHLDRFGSIENIKKAKFEIVEATQKISYVNIDNKNIEKYLHQADEKNIKFNCEITKYKMSGNDIKYEFLDDFKGISFEYKNNKYETKLIAHHVLGMIALALELADELQINIVEKKKGVKKIDYIPHRLQVIRNRQTGVTVIDDSYNGNFDGFCSGLETLSRAKGRKILMTPGIVELGEKKQEIHEMLAQKYKESNIDLFLIIENSSTQYILDYFQQNNFNRYKTYNTVFQAHDDLKNVLNKGDLILFQNDLSDNYS